MTIGAYLHLKPGNLSANSIFYVGKGSQKRMLDLAERNSWHKSITAKHGRANIEMAFLECSSEEFAFDLEKGLIKCLRRMGVTLCNLDSGGQGGRQLEQSVKDRMSKSHVGKCLSPETKQKIGKAHLGKIRPAGTGTKISLKLKGLKRTPDQRLAMSISAAKRAPHSAETKAKISASIKMSHLHKQVSK